MPCSCEFHLNHANGVYFSGQTVMGTIALTTNTEMNLRTIVMRLLGEAKVHWTETAYRRKFLGRSVSFTDFYRAHEVHVDKEAIILGADGGVLAPGTHTFQFNFQIPKSCPTSCGAKHGQLRYILQLRVERQFRSNIEFFKALTILKRVDLNLNPIFKLPLQVEHISTLGCWSCSIDKIMYNVCLPLGAYVCGQTLQYALEIHNQTRTNIRGYKVELIEYVTFIAHTPVYNERKQRSVIKCHECLDLCLCHSSRRYEGNLVVPALPPDTGEQGIIRIQHWLEFEIFINGCRDDRFVSVPIFIGNMPIRDTAQMEGPTPLPSTPTENPLVLTVPEEVVTEFRSASSLEASHLEELSAFGDIEPASFEEAINTAPPFIDPDAKESTDLILFKPLYPIYTQRK